LTVALRTVADHGEGVVFEVADGKIQDSAVKLRSGEVDVLGSADVDSLLELLERPVGSLVDGLRGTGKVKGLDSTGGL
jgi:hypothetical protein